MLWVLWFAMIDSYYGIFAWLPTLLVAAVGFGRVGGILAPMVVGWLLGSWSGRTNLVFTVFAAVILVGVAAVVLLGEETKGRSLEAI